MNDDSKTLVSAATDRSMVILPFSVYLANSELRLFMNVQKIEQVVECTDLSPLPASMRPFVGLYDMAGIVVPILDLRDYFNEDPPVLDHNRDTIKEGEVPRWQGARRMIICLTMDLHIGLIVDKTKTVQAINNADITAAPSLLNTSVFCAVARDPQGFRYLLDIESLLEKSGVPIGKPEPYQTNNTAALRGKRILFVDDSRFFQNLGRTLLEKFSATVEVAVDGQDALSKFTKTPDAYDLILTDIEMPIMSGIEMAKTIRKVNGSSIPIVFHSSISNTVLISELQTQGIGDYIVKFDEKSVIEAVLKHTSAPSKKVA